jgi:hypothetical protein
MYIVIVYPACTISTLWTDVHKWRSKRDVYYRNMDTSLIEEKIDESIQKNIENDDVSETVNIYPIIRHAFLTLCVLLAIAIILFLIYQNGKSIYDKGL